MQLVKPDRSERPIKGLQCFSIRINLAIANGLQKVQLVNK
jgi:hypothetical protein